MVASPLYSLAYLETVAYKYKAMVYKCEAIRSSMRRFFYNRIKLFMLESTHTFLRKTLDTTVIFNS